MTAKELAQLLNKTVSTYYQDHDFSRVEFSEAVLVLIMSIGVYIESELSHDNHFIEYEDDEIKERY